MKLALQATLSFGLLALCFAASPVRWCVTSDPEQVKCRRLNDCFSSQQSENLPQFSCVKKSDVHECITAIANNEADAITLDGGLVFNAGMAPYNLKPIVSEVYATGGGESVTSYHAVAVVKKGTVDSLADLRGKRSCHTGYQRTVGWFIPMGLLVAKKLIDWRGGANEPVEKASTRFFSASCVPGSSEPNLCRMCAGVGSEKCSRNDPYSGYSGALACLKNGDGDVAFVKDATVLDLSPEERSKYELLCEDGTKKPIEEYKTCNLASVPAHAVVARSVDGRADEIWTLLSYAKEQYSKHKQDQCRLFGPPEAILKDLMFKDSAVDLRRVPDLMDTHLFLGNKFYTAVQSLRMERVVPGPDTTGRIVWCNIGKAEKTKCDMWSTVNNGAVDCAVADDTESCIIKILKGEADAISLDGGHIYTAGKCGLVVVLAEVYPPDNAPCEHPELDSTVKGYTAVAVAKASDPTVTWKTLRGKKSCHTGRERTAGWTIPKGIISKENDNICDLSKFFSEGCAPGSPPESPLCNLCRGTGGSGSLPDKQKCKASSSEIYYGYSGCLRCLIEAGDVAFVRHSTVAENTGDNKPAWVGNNGPGDFVLLARNGERCPVSDYERCGLAASPPHAVVTRPDRAEAVRRVLLEQQVRYGSTGSEKDVFQMFQSDTKDSLFKDNTVCLATPKEKTYEAFLGQGYMDSVDGVKQCTPSELLKVCLFHQ